MRPRVGGISVSDTRLVQKPPVVVLALHWSLSAVAQLHFLPFIPLKVAPQP